MLAYILRRIFYSIIVLFAATILVFLLVAESGNPLGLLLANPKIPHKVIVQREQLLHLNDPLWQRYWIWFSHAIHGDFGQTIAGLPVAPQIESHFYVTLRMVVIATVLAVILAIGFGVYSALRKGRFGDHAVTTTNFVFLAVPTFIIGLVLKEFVAIPINQHAGRTIFYTIGEQSPGLTGSFWSRLPNYAGHTVLPVITLMLVSYGSWAIYQRASTLEVLDSDYVRLARAKGLHPRRVLTHHIVRNALISFTTVVALDFAAVLGGAIVTETIFGWQGMGVEFFNGVVTRDINVVLAYLLITTVCVIAFNLVADILYAFLDPRIRYG